METTVYRIPPPSDRLTAELLKQNGRRACAAYYSETRYAQPRRCRPGIWWFAVYLSTIGCLFLTDCTDYAGLRWDRSESGPPAGTYTWQNFFNRGCGPAQAVMLSRDGTGELIYSCTDGSNIRQSLKRYQTRGPVELWAAKGFTTGQLHQLSASKCQAATIYSGSESMTIKYPCALVHLTVAFSIQSTSNSEKGRFLRLQPTSVLITYPDGLQKFESGRIDWCQPVRFNHFSRLRNHPCTHHKYLTATCH